MNKFLVEVYFDGSLGDVKALGEQHLYEFLIVGNPTQRHWFDFGDACGYVLVYGGTLQRSEAASYALRLIRNEFQLVDLTRKRKRK